ncbi:MAG: hypothetical protein ABEL76_05535 [Bradymonadaceae bacterium]
MDLTYKIVRRLLRDDDVGFSRNKNFDAYDDERVEQAVRRYHHIESVEHELLELAPGGDAILGNIEWDGDQLAITFEYTDDRARRTSYLNPRDWQLLLENERIDAILNDLLEHVDAETESTIRDALASGGSG